MNRLRPWLELIRLPAVFTAPADVLAGFLLTHRSLEPTGQAAALVVASLCLYIAGMVFNDVFDLEVDHQERPQRPLPSGRVAYRAAMGLAVGLSAIGLIAGWSAGAASGAVATLLLGCVLLYDGVLKATWVGPAVMGSCRLLNVVLGASTAMASETNLLPPVPVLLLAGGVGLYITGVTWFSRQEAARSKRRPLAAALAVMNAGIAVVAAIGFTKAAVSPVSFWIVLAVVALSVSRRAVLALHEPSPARVQSAVKVALMSLVILDAAAVLAVGRPVWAIVVVALVLPAMTLGRWLYAT